MSNQADQLEDAVVMSCDLLGRDPAVRAIEVMTDVRPGYPELMHFQDLARAHGAALVVLGSGGFLLRPSCPGTVGDEREAIVAGSDPHAINRNDGHDGF